MVLPARRGKPWDLGPGVTRAPQGRTSGVSEQGARTHGKKRQHPATQRQGLRLQTSGVRSGRWADRPTGQPEGRGWPNLRPTWGPRSKRPYRRVGGHSPRESLRGALKYPEGM